MALISTRYRAIGYRLACNDLDQAQSLVQRLACGERDDPPRHRDAAGYTVEDFGLNLHLMLACSATVVVDNAQPCLIRIAQSLDADVAASGGDRGLG